MSIHSKKNKKIKNKKFIQIRCTNKKCRFIHQLMNEQQKKESGFDKNRPDMKSNDKDMKFKGKKDIRNNNPSGTNGMHNSVPLTREHQMQLGEPCRRWCLNTL